MGRRSLVLSLNLVVALDSLRVRGRRVPGRVATSRRRRRALGRAAALIRRSVVHDAMVLRLRLDALRVALLSLLSLLLRRAVTLDEDVGHAAALAILRHALVLVRPFGELGDDIPGVYQTGDLSRRRVSGLACERQRRQRRRSQKCGVSRTNPSMQSRMLMRESAEQIPHFTQTVERQQTLVGFFKACLGDDAGRDERAAQAAGLCDGGGGQR